jgi:hypothetical protein
MIKERIISDYWEFVPLQPNPAQAGFLIWNNNNSFLQAYRQLRSESAIETWGINMLIFLYLVHMQNW